MRGPRPVLAVEAGVKHLLALEPKPCIYVIKYFVRGKNLVRTQSDEEFILRQNYHGIFVLKHQFLLDAFRLHLCEPIVRLNTLFRLLAVNWPFPGAQCVPLEVGQDTYHWLGIILLRDG